MGQCIVLTDCIFVTIEAERCRKNCKVKNTHSRLLLTRESDGARQYTADCRAFTTAISTVKDKLLFEPPDGTEFLKRSVEFRGRRKLLKNWLIHFFFYFKVFCFLTTYCQLGVVKLSPSLKMANINYHSCKQKESIEIN